MKFERVAGVMTVPSNTEWESLLDQFLQSLPDPAMITDLQGSIRFVNDGVLHLVRLSRDEAIGQPFPYPWLLPQGHLDKLPWVNENRDFEGAARVESLVTDADGQHRIISFSITALPGPDGRIQWLLNIGRDITQQRNAEEIVENLEFDLIRVVEDMPAWVPLADLNGNIEMVNEAACAISEYDRSELIGQSWPYPWFQDNRSGGGSGPGTELPRAGQVLEFETICTTRQGHPKDLSRHSPDRTTFPGYSSRRDAANYNLAFQGRQMRPDSLKFLLSWTNHRPAKRKIPKPLVYDQVSSLGSPFALYDPVTVINPDAPKVD